MIHMETDNINHTNLISELIFIVYTFGQMFVLCDMGENLTNHFGHISDAIYCADWYMFPKDVQRIMPTVIMAAQRPVILQGFANLKCTRSAFKKVNFKIYSKFQKNFITLDALLQIVKGGFSYFMTLRQFT